MKFRARHLAWTVLATGCLGMSLPALLSVFNSWPFFYPHWTAYAGYFLVGVSIFLARKRSEARGVFVIAFALASLSTWLSWDPAMLNWVFSYNEWYGLVLDYIEPLAILSLAIPCFAVLLSRKLLRHETDVA